MTMTEDSRNEEKEHSTCADLRTELKRPCQLPARFQDSDTESDDCVFAVWAIKKNLQRPFSGLTVVCVVLGCMHIVHLK